MHLHTCACVHICLHALDVHVYIYIYVYMCIRVPGCIAHRCVPVNINIYIRMTTDEPVRIDRYGCIHTYIHKNFVEKGEHTSIILRAYSI